MITQTLPAMNIIGGVVVSVLSAGGDRSIASSKSGIHGEVAAGEVVGEAEDGSEWLVVMQETNDGRAIEAIVFGRYRQRHRVLDKLPTFPLTTMFQTLFSPGRLDQNPPHRFGRRGKEMTAVIPPCMIGGSHKPKIRFVNQGRGL